MYAVHPSVAYARTIVANIPARTGRSIEDWTALIKRDGPNGTKARIAWLRQVHGLGGSTAFMLVDWAEGRTAEYSDEGYLAAAPLMVDAIYAGKKAALRPLHDRLVAEARALGPDVRACPMSTIVPLYRTHVFAQIKPSTNRRIDLGLALKGEPGSGRLIPLKADDNRITHRIGVTAEAGVDAEVMAWLQQAYNKDA